MLFNKYLKKKQIYFACYNYINHSRITIGLFTISIHE